MSKFVGNLFIFLYDILIHLYEMPRVYLRFRYNYKNLIKNLLNKNAQKIAIVCIHPKESLRFNQENLLKALSKNNYEIIIPLVNTNISPWFQSLKNIHIVPRSKYGRDFGVWKDLILEFKDSKVLSKKITSLILVNDSLYFTNKTHELIREVSDTKYNWSCLYENFEHHYHAQSFLLHFNAIGYSSSAFTDFWKKYKPYSSRRHSIDKGEVKLSKKLVKSIGVPYIIYSSTSINAHIKNMNLNQLKELTFLMFNNIGFHSVLKDSLLDLKIMLSMQVFEQGYTKTRDVNERLLIIKNKIYSMIHFLMEETNPTHSTGLLFNNLLSAPLKRDLCYRGINRIGDVIKFSAGFSSDEKKQIELDLRKKALPISIKGLKKLLFVRGRI